MPLVANGEIWTVADALRCREVSGCQSLMLGRGMVADPALAQAILAVDADRPEPVVMAWPELFELIEQFWLLVVAHLDRGQQTGRLKQWLNLLRRVYPQAQDAFLAVRTFHDPADATNWLKAQRVILGIDSVPP